uniref:ABC transporter permease n=1 Tax=candidate division WOR-3 bacterium TaxID=2052148 RepID=A0A7V4E5E3_UNCW3
MRRTLEIAKITFKQALRERSFYIILVLLLLAMIGMPVLYSFTMFEIPRILTGFALSFANFVVLVLMLFLILGLIQTDLERKTLQYVISLPIKRKDYVIGRYLGFLAFSAFLVYLVLFLLFPFIYYFSRLRPDAPFYAGYYFLYGIFLLVEIQILVAFALLFISLTSRAIVSMFGVVGVYVAGHTIDEVAEFLRTRMGMQMPAFSKIVINVARYLFPNLALFDVKTNFIYNVGINPAFLIFSVIYGILYGIIVLGIAVVLFERKEIL